MREAHAYTLFLLQALYWDVALPTPATFSPQLDEFPASDGDLTEPSGLRLVPGKRLSNPHGFPAQPNGA